MYLANDQQQSYGTKYLHDYTQSQWKEYYFKKSWLYIIYLKNCVCGWVRSRTHEHICDWRFKDNLWESLLSHHIGLKDQSQVLMLAASTLSGWAISTAWFCKLYKWSHVEEFQPLVESKRHLLYCKNLFTNDTVRELGEWCHLYDNSPQSNISTGTHSFHS